MFYSSSTALFAPLLSDEVVPHKTIPKPVAEALFVFFQRHALFRWSGSHNDCEDRANAVSLLLDRWGIPNYKAWVFSGSYLKKKSGYLHNFWNYHVATILPVQEEGSTAFYVLDPATLSSLETAPRWAERIIQMGHCYYLVKHSHYYIFHHKKIEKANWHKRDRQNFKWTMQGLAGINGLSSAGKACLAFNKRRIKNTELQFKALEKNKPAFLTR